MAAASAVVGSPAMVGPRTTSVTRLRAGAAALVVTASACGDDRGAPGGVTATASGAHPSASAPPSASASTSAAPAASASAAPASPWSGAWTGTYRAEKAMPTLDPTVEVKPWKTDDGKRGSGEGQLRIDVAPGGEVKGELLGPLGPADVVGLVEGERLHAQLVPRDDGEESFGGNLEGKLAEGELSITIRASDGAAATVRKAAGKLARR